MPHCWGFSWDAARFVGGRQLSKYRWPQGLSRLLTIAVETLIDGFWPVVRSFLLQEVNSRSLIEETNRDPRQKRLEIGKYMYC